ncbi:LacI family DNA-binding transcriptional regulator [Silvibacterium dinghuense]|uniref:LacI family transcriptional regulator n=1 Tax=Silvibacterium dinghuense TaxID=1560006 RepID=A0A4Q1SBN7_9BACT|nr:LacI family DNA-binding transcriptional regulator [Silvibacterium dinghuense]RXS94551.1 LacI family transcriptional regulator [Silvibacterium dinghuense]GGH15415.1 LacI family transcriptional regulator [Silvibacterium dinghuense]
MAKRKSGHVTLSDVAHAAGFSVSTVSIVLSEAPLSRHVAATTREHIRATAAHLGYHPDAFARSLRKRSSRTIGVLAFDLSDPYCVPIVRGIHSALQSSEYLPMVLDAQTERRLFDEHLRLLLERRVEGVIVIASWVFDEANLFADVRKNSVPIVIIGRDLSARGVSSFLLDNEEGGAQALRHLAGLGHRRIAVITGPHEMFDSKPRWLGVERASEECGIALDPLLVQQLPSFGDAEHGFEGGREIAKRLVNTGRPFTAVLAFDDLTALGVVRGLAEMGIHVPQDCSVIGFDDVLPARVATPAITTIRQPLRSMGEHAAQRMLERLAAPQQARERARVHKAAPQLIVRSSTALYRKSESSKGRRKRLDSR